jgi:hypothetical protein
MSALTIETLEHMFVYLGCANIPTQSAMDGAIPLESLCGKGADSTVSCFTMRELELLGSEWSTKAIWFAGDNLGLSTVESVHWSTLSLWLNHWSKTYKASGYIGGSKSFTDEADGFVKIFYSEIDRFGRFEKFPVRKKRVDSLIAKKIYNPDWLLEFTNGGMRCISSDSDKLFEEKGISFLAPFLCGLAQSLGSYWLVRTRFDDICPSLTLLTDPTGVKEFWKLRDVPDGHKRRSALLHWVHQHWRQTRKDPDVEAFVRKHMRGETAVKQGKFEAEITPSKRDSLDEEKAIQQREMLRKLKIDRRRRHKRLMTS